MFFSTPDQIAKIAATADTAIFAINPPSLTEVGITPYFILEPNEKGKITVDMARELLDACSLKQQKSAYICINHAETLGNEAQNSLLKALEEPKAHYHFLIFTPTPSALLPTILSRAEIYFQSESAPLSTPVNFPDQIKEKARTLLSLKSADLPQFADQIAKHKDDTREYALKILAAAIEIAYKSYFATSNPLYLDKIPRLLNCHQNISANGHIKLHLIADLL